MRSATCLFVSAFLCAPSLAAANCYSIYTTQNRLTYQSTVAPIDLSMRISDAMRARFPGDFFVMIPDDTDCREIREGSTTRPRLDAVGQSGASATTPDRLLQASPLFRDLKPASVLDSAGGGRRSSGDVLPTKGRGR